MKKTDLQLYSSKADDCPIPDKVKRLLDELQRSEHALNARRRYHRDTSSDTVEILSAVPSAEDEYFRQLLYVELYAALQQLPKKQRQRIYAHFFLGWSMTQIARAEMVSVAAVSKSIHSGIAELRRLISGQ